MFLQKNISFYCENRYFLYIFYYLSKKPYEKIPEYYFEKGPINIEKHYLRFN